MAHNFVIKGRTSITIISAKVIARLSSSLSNAEAKSWWPKIQRRSPNGNSYDTMTDNTRNALLSKGNR
jgi:hypothetical protein